MTTPLLQLADVRKRYNIGLPNEAEVLRGVSFALARGEFAARRWVSCSSFTTCCRPSPRWRT